MSLMGHPNTVKETVVPVEMLVKIKNILWVLHAPVTRNEEIEGRRKAREMYDILEGMV